MKKKIFINDDFKVGDKVMTIQGERIVTGVKKDVIIFDNGFAPKDRVTKIYK